MKFWLALGFVREVDQLVALARAAEGAGFHGVTIADHLAMPATFASKYPYSADGAPFWPLDTPWPDPWPTLAAIGGATSRLWLATNVYLAGLRGPIAAARAVATVSALVGPRVACGVSAGWLREEHELLGVDFHTRGARLDETIDAMKALWTGEVVARDGAHVQFAPTIVRPVPRAPVPVWVGGASDAALARAARADGWLGLVHTRESARPHLARLRELRARAGRDDAPFDVAFALGEKTTPEVCRELEADGVTGLIVTPWRRPGLDATAIDVKLASIARFAEGVIGPCSTPSTD